jgi:hypothetical protein
MGIILARNTVSGQVGEMDEWVVNHEYHGRNLVPVDVPAAEPEQVDVPAVAVERKTNEPAKDHK